VGVLVLALAGGAFMIQQARRFQSNAGLQLNYSIITNPDSSIVIEASSPQAGYLYMLDGNERIFPAGEIGAGRITSGEVVRIPPTGGLRPDPSKPMRLIWSTHPVARPNNMAQAPEAQAYRDEASNRTILSSNQDVLVHQIPLPRQ
jgi:hypothetical protein